MDELSRLSPTGSGLDPLSARDGDDERQTSSRVPLGTHRAAVGAGATSVIFSVRDMGMRDRTLAILVALAVAAAGCSDDSSTGPNGTMGGPIESSSGSIAVRNNVFTPSATTVSVGTPVIWTWAQGATDHNVTFNDGQQSATQPTGTYSRSFTSAGTFAYQCTIHSGMGGTVTVR